jgi:hypothetical protein
MGVNVLNLAFPLLEALDLGPQLFFALAELMLEATEHLIVFTFGKGEIIVGQLGVLLLELAF